MSAGNASMRGGDVHIVIAEDSPTQAAQLTFLLEEQGFAVSAASNGREALQAAKRVRPDVVISDVVMPEMDGYDLCRAIKADPELVGTPVILVTEMSSPNDVFRGLDAGADNFLVKPYEREHLLSRVVYLLANRTLRTAGKLQVGIEIELSGQRHFITAERQQILDLLISTYDQAVRLYDALDAKQKELARSYELLEQKVQERTRELRASQEMISAILDGSPAAIIALDRRDCVLTWNRAAERMFGFPAEAVLGQACPTIPDDLRAEHESMIAQLRQGRPIKDLETRRVHRDGNVLLVRISAEPLFDVDGAYRGVVIGIEDLTERRRVEEQFRQAQKMEAIGSLTGGIAHDFNNMLAVMIGNLDLLEEHIEPNSRARDILEGATQAALRGAELNRQLLAFARKQVLAPEVIDVGRSVGGTVRLLDRALGETIRVRLVESEGLWPVLIDPAQFDSAIVNLAINARDAMPNGGELTIEMRNVIIEAESMMAGADVSPGDYVVVEVSDSGSGIPPDMLNRIFEPFFTTKPQGKGTGLGLAMVYGFVKQSGGHLTVYSELGHGTTFRMYLPRATAVGDAPQPHPAEPPARRRSDATILVVDDNVDVGRVVEEQVRSLGYRVLGAQSGEKALALLEAGHEIDLVFSDVVMSDAMSGITLAEEITERWPRTKVLLTSGFSDTAIKNNRRAARFPMLGKPYRKSDLEQRIREILG